MIPCPIESNKETVKIEALKQAIGMLLSGERLPSLLMVSNVGRKQWRRSKGLARL